MRLFTVLSLGGAPKSTLPNISTWSRHFEAFAAAMRIVTSGKRSTALALFWSPWAHRIFTSQSSDMTDVLARLTPNFLLLLLLLLLLFQSSRAV